jgi:hypothetical protein
LRICGYSQTSLDRRPPVVAAPGHLALAVDVGLDAAAVEHAFDAIDSEGSGSGDRIPTHGYRSAQFAEMHKASSAASPELPRHD